VDNNEVDLPNMPIKAAAFDTSTVGERTTTAQEFIEHLACDSLEDSQSGWEDGEGSHGDGGGLALDLATRETIDCADWLTHPDRSGRTRWSSIARSHEKERSAI
jgi:hypothetical protein